MILLGANVVSEAMKPDPEPAVRAWLDAQAAEPLHLSSVTVAELTFEIGPLPNGARRNKLAAALDGVLQLFGTRILPFDTSATRSYADLAVNSRFRQVFPHVRRLHRSDRRRAQFRSRVSRYERLHVRRPHRVDPWTAGGSSSVRIRNWGAQSL